jgi:hypothetical protein
MNKEIVKEIECHLCARSYKTKTRMNCHLQQVHSFSKADARQFCIDLNIVTESELLSKENVKSTCLKRYGVPAPGMSQQAKEAKRKTNLKRYGVEHAFQAESVKEKCKQTHLERYGVENCSQRPEIQEKKKATCLERYGYEWHLASPEIQAQITETCLEKYGALRAPGNVEIKKKMKKTMFEKYGCWFSQTDEHQKANYQWKDYILPSGKSVQVQGYEPLALDILFETYSEDDVLIDLDSINQHVGKIWYTREDGSDHRYFPDIYIISEKKFIEVKSVYTYAQHRLMNEAKRDVCIANGYGFEFWVFDPKDLFTLNIY